MVSQPNTEFVIKALNGDVGEILRNLTINITAELRKETPRDTGFAAAMWVPNIGSPFRGEPSSPAAAQAAQQSGLAQAASIQDGSRDVFISNNTTYIQRLNEGYSKKAPAGYVQAIVEREVQKAQAQNP